MNDSFENRRAGMVFGSLVAEALSLGVHWIYDPVELEKRHRRVTKFQAPGAESYHPRKKAGEQGHVGDQALRLMHFLAREKCWDARAFLDDWRAMWPSYADYFDHATKETLKNLEQGKPSDDAAAESDELAGPARIAPLVAFLGGPGQESEAIAAAIAQTRLTHRSAAADEAAEFLARAGHRVLQGAKLEDTVRELAPGWALAAAEKVLDRSAVAAIGELGRACSLSGALPSVIFLVLKHGDDFAEVCVENAMAGGDNCARALAVGMLVGAAHGLSAIPPQWRSELVAAGEVETFVAGLG